MCLATPSCMIAPEINGNQPLMIEREAEQNSFIRINHFPNLTLFDPLCASCSEEDEDDMIYSWSMNV
jgi:hypothetical protein